MGEMHGAPLEFRPQTMRQLETLPNEFLSQIWIGEIALNFVVEVRPISKRCKQSIGQGERSHIDRLEGTGLVHGSPNRPVAKLGLHHKVVGIRSLDVVHTTSLAESDRADDGRLFLKNTLFWPSEATEE